jgi:hypothetical protein
MYRGDNMDNDEYVAIAAEFGEDETDESDEEVDESDEVEGMSSSANESGDEAPPSLN